MEKIRDFMKKNALEYDFTVKVKEPADKTVQNERIIAFLNGILYCYTLDYSLLATYYLTNLTECEISEQSVYLTFQSTKFSFVPSKGKETKKFLLKNIPTLLSNFELHQNGMHQFQDAQSRPTLKSVTNRMQSKAKQMKIDNIDNIIDIMSRVFTYRESKVVFWEFKSIKNAYLIVLDVLPLYTFVNSVVAVSTDSFDPFDLLSDFAMKNRTIEFFRLEGKLTSKFDKFIHAIQANTEMKVQGIIFDGHNFTSQALRMLSSCIAAKSIPFIGFRNAINTETTNTFYNFFLTGPAHEHIKYFCIDSISNVKVLALVSKLTNLTVLSITNCSLNISKVIPILSNTHLRTVNFSGNNCLTSLAEVTAEPPSTLVHIIVNDVMWGNSTLIGFFKYLEKHFTGPMKVGMAQAEAQTEEWVNFFSNIENIKFNNLRELIWNNNPVHYKLFRYLRKNPKFYTLSMNGCFHEIDPETIIQLSIFLTSTKSLKRLSIESNENAYLGKYTIPVLTAVQTSTKLNYLNISNCKCGDDGVTQLKYIIKQSSNIETLHCDGLCPSNAQAYNDFINVAVETKKKRKFNFFYPQTDLNNLLHAKKIDKSAIDTIKGSLSDHEYIYHGECKLELTEFVK